MIDLSTGKPFPRGAIPTPAHVLAAAPLHTPVGAVTQVAYVPPKLDMWGNSQYGCCVTSEEAYAKATGCISDGQCLPEIFVDPSITIAWARKGGFLNGAMLTDVMDAMAQHGFVVGSQEYRDGGYAKVDFTDESRLQGALAEGPVKIGIDANALPKGAGNDQGWYALGTGHKYPSTDHCVSIGGFGTAEYLFDALKVSLPSALTASQPGYLLFTWSTLGFVDHKWIMSTTTEAWVRNPTTVGVPPLQPPEPTPIDWKQA